MKNRMLPATVAVLVLAVAATAAIRLRPRADLSTPESEYFSSDFVKNQFKLAGARKKLRIGGDVPHTVRPDEIAWAPTLDAAIEQATAEDKPIFVFQFVRENGDPACDV